MKVMSIMRKIFWSALAMWLLSSSSVFAVQEGDTADTKLTSPLKDSIGSIDKLVETILNSIVLPIGASVAAVAIIYSGFLYVKAQGKPGELEKAHEAIKWTLVGTAVILGAWVISQLIGGTIDKLR